MVSLQAEVSMSIMFCIQGFDSLVERANLVRGSVEVTPKRRP